MSLQGLFDRYEATLNGLARKSRLRKLSSHLGLDFASNDYLGLARSKRMAEAVGAALAAGTPIGATGSRLLRGNAPEHEALEAKAADFFGAERALFFGGGYVGNFAVLTTLPQNGDLIVLDELVHASAHEGARAGRADVVEAAHNDAGAVDDAIIAWRVMGGTGRPWIVVESLYSMDGDRAPLRELIEIADRHEAFLFVDEAHATGIYGPVGCGLAHGLEGRDNVVVLHTCGKALGASGALVTAPAVLCDYLVNRCRPFIYATAPSPLMAVAVATAPHIVAH
ncbi:8-amino-7-oxononanoate synthase, partial [Mesorhizobium sp. M1A.F.Ca.IN.020.32.1.1]|uniref:8-amino-7-oxononanoate synthase n=1 Tax=Mesorhizobium sp. M1A.F.Ca.IN.020.32.1.1 TaxID=2496763 RepID=UPI000FD2AABC